MALRKARTLVKSGAKIVATSRDFSEPFLRFVKRSGSQIRHGGKLPKGLKPSLVVVATSDREFNRRIGRKYQKEGIFVNVVDDPKHSTFIVPSVLSRGPLQIAISTGGRSPLLAKTLRKKLSVQFGRKYGALIEQLGKDRQNAKRSIRQAKARRNHFRKLVTSRLKALENRS